MLKVLATLWQRLTADTFPAAQEYYRERRPTSLPPIEAELRTAIPRPFVWTFEHEVSSEERELLVRGIAARAWVIGMRNVNDDPEGPDIYVTYAYEAGGSIRVSSIHRGYDRVHLHLGAARFADWMAGAFREHGTFTVLHVHDMPQEHVIYGELHPLIAGEWAAR
jgi:hypothetical protein